jgi:hypothetical protein
MMGRPSSSSEERTTISISSEGSTCFCTGDGGPKEEVSSGDPSGSGEPDGDGGCVEAPLDEDEDSLAKEHERLVPLFSSILNK